jgi:ribonuclease T2
MVHSLKNWLAVGLFLAASWASAAAQDRRQNAAGEFDFYVLSLSWSPSFCEASTERSNGGRTQQMQCGGRPYAFVVHGLWPQYERGFPNYCQRPSPRLDRNIMQSMLDLMPAPGLVFSEWDKHGTCSGLGARGYFEAVRKARAGVKIPDEYLDLSASAMSVVCDRTRLTEIRICLSKDLQFRACEEIDRRACRRDSIVMPPMRGG